MRISISRRHINFWLTWYYTLPRSWSICSWQNPFLPMVISGRAWMGQLFFVEKSQFLRWLFLKIDLAILGDFEKKLDNFEKCYYHFCFTNLVTQYYLLNFVVYFQVLLGNIRQNSTTTWKYTTKFNKQYWVTRFVKQKW